MRDFMSIHWGVLVPILISVVNQINIMAKGPWKIENAVETRALCSMCGITFSSSRFPCEGASPVA